MFFLFGSQNIVQRTGLAAVWALEFRQPVTEVDDCNIADFIFIGLIAFCRAETEANSEQKLMLTTSSPNCSKPNVGCRFCRPPKTKKTIN